MERQSAVPILVPFEPEDFWNHIRSIVREEIARDVNVKNREQVPETPLTQTPGLTEKPLYKMAEVCKLFKITKPTIYDWIKHGMLRPVKIRSRVYFLVSEVQRLIQ